MECTWIFLLCILFPLKMNIAIYNADFFISDGKLLYFVTIYTYVYIDLFMHFSHKMNVVVYHLYDVLLHFQIYLKGNWYKRIIQVSSLFSCILFIVIEHSIRNKTSDTRNTRSVKYGTKQIQAY